MKNIISVLSIAALIISMSFLTNCGGGDNVSKAKDLIDQTVELMKTAGKDKDAQAKLVKIQSELEGLKGKLTKEEEEEMMKYSQEKMGDIMGSMGKALSEGMSKMGEAMKSQEKQSE